jgi:hypothetical protein
VWVGLGVLGNLSREDERIRRTCQFGMWRGSFISEEASGLDDAHDRGVAEGTEEHEVLAEPVRMH